MILSCAEMKAVEEQAFQEGVAVEALMEDAGFGIAKVVRRTFPKPGVCAAVFGKGNNGGDALVAARHLAVWGWEIFLVPAFPQDQWGELVRRNFEKLQGCEMGGLKEMARMRGEPLVVLDGLLGIGATGGLAELLSGFTKEINALRAHRGAHVFALDIPTGLDADRGDLDPAAVIADTTVTLGFCKPGLISDGATTNVGRLCVVPLEELTKRAPKKRSGPTISTVENIAPAFPKRGFDTHKGDYGRVGIVAGSAGMLGAAVLCATACMRAGAGLVTLYASADVAPQLIAMAPPEVMVKTVHSFLEVLGARHDVFAIGPGLGQKHADDIQDLILQIPEPMVLDADGVNILALQPELLNQCDGIRLVTPHPGEMARLAPDLAGKNRVEVVKAFVNRYPDTTLLLKGARTLIGLKGERLAYNSTGGPGMAKGGMGDVLTGVTAALLAQKLRAFDAARVGAWWCGRAAELAIDLGGETEETVTPSRMLDFLAPALRELRRG